MKPWEILGHLHAEKKNNDYFMVIIHVGVAKTTSIIMSEVWEVDF